MLRALRLRKLRSTYVGKPHDGKQKGPTGFWQYLFEGRIHPSFMLHRAVTGRTTSADPNGQNIPKRGKAGMKDIVKAYRKIFVPTPGYKFIEIDLSQAELRIAAWMSGDPVMLRIYREGGDIHAMTAAAVMGITLEAFNLLPPEVRDMKRFQAKAVSALSNTNGSIAWPYEHASSRASRRRDRQVFLRAHSSKVGR